MAVSSPATAPSRAANRLWLDRAGRVQALGRCNGPRQSAMESDILRRIIWAGLLAATGALASLTAHRVAAVIWLRVFKEEPPQ